MTRRIRAVLILGAAGLIYVVAFLVVQSVQVYAVGDGTWISDDHLVPGEVSPIRGSGWLGDTIRLGAMVAVGAVLLAVWAWLARALGTGHPEVNEAQPHDDASWYVVRTPWLIKTMHGLAVFCIVTIAIVGAALLPFIIVKFGWNQ